MYKQLFKIVENLDVYTLTSSNEEEVFNSETYTPTPGLSGSDYHDKGEMSKESFTLTFSMTDLLAGRWLQFGTDYKISLTVFEKNEVETVPIFKGLVTQVKPEKGAIKAVFESIFTGLRKSNLEEPIQRNCGYVHYGDKCRVNSANFALAANVTASTNATVLTVAEAASYPDGYFSLGMLKLVNGVTKFITKHEGDQLTLIRPFGQLEELLAVTNPLPVGIYPGCDRSMATCDDTFNNLARYPGRAYIPTTNPFGGNSIF